MMGRKWVERTWLALAVAGAGAGCRAAAVEEAPRLPFHVAIAPIHDPLVRATRPERDLDRTDLVLDPDLVRLAGAVAASFERECFVRATVLAPVPSDAADRDRALVEAARAAGADMLVALDFRYEPDIWEEKSGAFWPNMFLFGLGGPLCYFLKDRTYSSKVDLTASFHDLELLRETSLASRTALVLDASAGFEELSLNFLERTGRSFTPYLASVVVPSGFLSVESEVVHARFDGEVEDALCSELVDSVKSDRLELLTGQRTGFPFELDPAQIELVRRANGRVALRGVVTLDAGSRAGRMTAFELFCAGNSATGEFGRGVAETRPGGKVLLRYEFAAEVDVPADARNDTTVQLVLEAGTVHQVRRSYTFALP